MVERAGRRPEGGRGNGRRITAFLNIFALTLCNAIHRLFGPFLSLFYNSCFFGGGVGFLLSSSTTIIIMSTTFIMKLFKNLLKNENKQSIHNTSIHSEFCEPRSPDSKPA